MMSDGVASVVFATILTPLGVFMTFRQREARTWRMVVVVGVLVALIWLVLLESPTGLPSPARAALQLTFLVIWYAAFSRGTALGLFALSPAENHLNETLRSISRLTRTGGPDVDLVQRPQELKGLLQKLDALDPPNEWWARVIRLTREFLLALPAGQAVPPDSLLEYLMWQAVWFDTHDRRILFAPRLGADMEFRADLHLDRTAVLRALAEGRTADADSLIERLATRTAPTADWRETQRLLVEALHARLTSVVAGRDPERDGPVVAADAAFRDAWVATGQPGRVMGPLEP